MLSLIALCCLAAAPVPGSPLARAEQAVQQLDFAAAREALSQAREQPDLDLASWLRILELTGEVSAQRGDRTTSLDAFRELLFLNPPFSLDNRWPPKVRLIYLEARDEVSRQPPLMVEACPPRIERGQVARLCVHLGPDPLHLFQGVRVHLLAPGQPELQLVVPVSGPGDLLAPVSPAPTWLWWAEVLGAHNDQLALLGDGDHPQVDRAPDLTPPSPPTSAAPLGLTAPPPRPADEAELRPLAYGLGIGGLAALGAGAYFGVQAKGDESTFANAARDSQGRVTGLTQRAGFELGNQSKTDALTANVLLGVGATAAIACVVTYLVGSP